MSAAWAGNPILVRSDGDVARRVSVEVATENAPNDFRLYRVDFEQARFARHRPIAVASAAIVSSVAHNAGLAAMRLLRKVLVERAKQSLDADMDLSRHTGIRIIAVQDGGKTLDEFCVGPTPDAPLQLTARMFVASMSQLPHAGAA